MSIFAGALTDRFDKKKLMLICDTFAAVCTVTILALFCTGQLSVWHLYLLNMVSGLMNTVQQPASDVAMTLIVPQEGVFSKNKRIALSVEVVDFHFESAYSYGGVFFSGLATGNCHRLGQLSCGIR